MNQKEFFNQNGYLLVPGLIADPENLKVSLPKERGQITYYNNKMDKFKHCPNEEQVPGSLARYNIPIYKELHFLIKKEIEQILEMDLFPTYFYDRFYFPGQELKRHIDRYSCEISVTLQISTTLKNPWPIWFQKDDKSEVSIIMNNGDATIYRGCEREHWREPMPSNYNKLQKRILTFCKKNMEEYHHQIFFHYVNANGPYVHYAFDAAKM